jgi:hypothetical protein
LFVLTTLALGFVAAVLVAEFVARWGLRAQDKYWLWKPYYREYYGLDSRAYQNCPSPVRFIVNGEGERGYELPRNAPKLYRVLVAGGSAAESYALDQDTSWPVVLQRILERPENLKKLGATHVHVGNIGKSGVGAEMLDFILQRVLRRMGPIDVIMIMVGASDSLHWLHSGAPPTPHRSITPKTNMDDIFGWHPLGPFRMHPRQMALTEIVRRIHRVVLKPIWRKKDTGTSLLRAEKMRENAEEVRTEAPHPEVVTDNFEIYFRKALQTAMAKAKRVIVVRQPWMAKPKVGVERWTNFSHGAVGNVFKSEVKVFYSTEVVAQMQELIDQSAARVAEEMGIECCEVRSAIEPTFNSYYDLYHFTPAGAAVAAAVVANVVLDEPAAATPATTPELLQTVRPS